MSLLLLLVGAGAGGGGGGSGSPLPGVPAVLWSAPGYAVLVANRWQPMVRVFEIEGYDFSAATFKMQVRAYRDAPNSLVSLGNADAGYEGISAEVETVGGGVPTTTITVRVSEPTLEALPFTVPRGEDLDLVWDFVIEATGFEKARWIEGRLIVHGGSTQN